MYPTKKGEKFKFNKPVELTAWAGTYTVDCFFVSYWDKFSMTVYDTLDELLDNNLEHIEQLKRSLTIQSSDFRKTDYPAVSLEILETGGNCEISDVLSINKLRKYKLNRICKK